MKRALLILVSTAFLAAACGGGTQYKNVNDAKGSGTWGPYEIKRTTKKMVLSLYTYLKKNNMQALIQLKRIRNRTSEHIDTQMLSKQIVKNLIKNGISFIDDTYDKDAIKEMKKGMTGIIDPKYAIPVGKLQSPNLFLYGEVTDNVRYVGGRKVQYIVVTLQLKELATRRLKWMEDKEFLKSTKSDRISF